MSVKWLTNGCSTVMKFSLAITKCEIAWVQGQRTPGLTSGSVQVMQTRYVDSLANLLTRDFINYYYNTLNSS